MTSAPDEPPEATPHATGPARHLSGVRRRDAAATRQRLLDAARHRFTSTGYSATTVRHIADDAGVNVALIFRYFESKEALFRACLSRAVDEAGRTLTDTMTPELAAHAIAGRVADHGADSHPNWLMLLLRSSGDERGDQIRLEILRSAAERLASIAGWRPDDPDGDRQLLRAQTALASAVGIAMLRAVRLEPLASADRDDLTEPLREVFDALLRPQRHADQNSAG